MVRHLGSGRDAGRDRAPLERRLRRSDAAIGRRPKSGGHRRRTGLRDPRTIGTLYGGRGRAQCAAAQIRELPAAIIACTSRRVRRTRIIQHDDVSLFSRQLRAGRITLRPESRMSRNSAVPIFTSVIALPSASKSAMAKAGTANGLLPGTRRETHVSPKGWAARLRPATLTFGRSTISARHNFISWVPIRARNTPICAA